MIRRLRVLADMMKILQEEIENLSADNTELRLQVSMLRDGLESLLACPGDRITVDYAKLILTKTSKDIGKGVVFYE